MKRECCLFDASLRYVSRRRLPWGIKLVGGEDKRAFLQDTRYPFSPPFCPDPVNYFTYPICPSSSLSLSLTIRSYYFKLYIYIYILLHSYPTILFLAVWFLNISSISTKSLHCRCRQLIRSSRFIYVTLLLFSIFLRYYFPFFSLSLSSLFILFSPLSR